MQVGDIMKWVTHLCFDFLLIDLLRPSLAAREPDQGGMVHPVCTPTSQTPVLGIPRSSNAAILCSFTVSKFEMGPEETVNSVEEMA